MRANLQCKKYHFHYGHSTTPREFQRKTPGSVVKSQFERPKSSVVSRSMKCQITFSLHSSDRIAERG